ncbi:PAP/OAS1 substrate-binding domain superfamily [Raphanus sativus]|uniref:Protein HESO1-like isoform X1 n=1 Tax=Raphanus sativus TaxID=3726 RepID=A0A6J0LIE0_RAPSA|nr:protein HESO1-like isoform X1 [Raphanus sativus]KAJ4905127.1 PAP/OAS1 substrate-binding domain superfamily [Raphanus sativus]
MGSNQERLSVSSLSMTTAQPRGDSLAIDVESWMIAEERAHEILSVIQPFLVSDRNRHEIIDYVRALIRSHDGIEVFSFGSVPLKTYLPDGDIDLTVITKQNMEDKFFEKLYNTLKSEEGKSEFDVTDVKFIPAQVKVIKCNIRNIAVDISFNQMAGLYALCFLEQIDQLLGRDHLLKRSIILIKAWCYYESRILGANTGLFSTYALSILVLYIINLFHSSLSGPLSVMYKFLDYYGSFDWSKYCVSLIGPVPISSLPKIIAVSPENGHQLFLDEKALKTCVELYFASPTKAVETNGLEFPIRHLNIIDPLKHSNNLGRSVTIGNVQRVKHAFTLGARKLRDVLSQPYETIGWRLEKFFGSSLERNGKGQRQDVYDPVTAFGTGRSELSELTGDFQGYYGRLVSYQNNEFYLRGLNGSTWMQPNGYQNMGKRRGTGTYIPDMSQQLYHDRFRGSGTGKSAAHHRDASTEANGASSSFNLSGEVATSSASIKGKERVKSDSISSSIPEKENDKEEEESKTSQTLKSS